MAVLILSCYVCSVLSDRNCSVTRNNQREVKGVLNASFTVSPYDNLLPLEPSELSLIWRCTCTVSFIVSTSVVLVSVIGAIALLSLLVYWPLPK